MKTKTISNFGIIFAVALTMVTTVVFTACNSDDDFGGDFNGDITGQYTLATRMMTRPMEGAFVTDTIIYPYNVTLGSYDNAHAHGFDATLYVKFRRNETNDLSVYLQRYTAPFKCNIYSVSLVQHTYPNTYRVTASGRCEHGVDCHGEVGEYVF